MIPTRRPSSGVRKSAAKALANSIGTMRLTRGRSEARQKNTQPKHWERAVDLLSKPFSIWVLSSVLVTSVGWALTKLWSDLDAKAARREEIRRIDVELSSRLLIALDELATLKSRVAAGQYESTNYSWVLNFGRGCLDGVPPPLDGRHTGCPGIYPDWSNRNYLSLLTQLAVSLPESERKEVIEARERARRLLVQASGPYIAKAANGPVGQSEIAESIAQVDRAMQAYLSELQLNRWSATSWSTTDGLVQR